MDIKKLRQKILDLAISGKLVPQNPNDEPASVLLERIRAEKERLIAEGKIKRPKKSKSSSAESHYRNFPPPFPIPDSWVWVKLDEITFCIVDCPHTTAKNEGQGFALIRTPNVGEGELMLNGVHRVSENIYNLRNARAVPTNGDIIYAREAPAGNAAVVRQEKVCLGQRTVLIKPLKEFCNSEYLAYALLAPLSKNRLISKATGSTVQHVNLENIRPFKIPFPPLEEQERIVVKLKGFFKLLTNVSTGADILSSLIKNCKSKILDLAMQGKLVPQNPADEPAADMLLRINPKAKIITDNPHYPQLPDNWVHVSLEDITEYEQPLPYIVQDTSYSDRYTIPVLTAGKSFILGYTNEDFGVYENVPAIIFDDFTTDSRLVNFPFKVKSSAMKIIQVKHGLNIEYIALFMSITRLMGETHKRYWISEYSKILIPIPPLKEQDRIVERVNVLYHELYKIISVLSA